LRAYFEAHRFGNIDSEGFKQFFLDYFKGNPSIQQVRSLEQTFARGQFPWLFHLASFRSTHGNPRILAYALKSAMYPFESTVPDPLPRAPYPSGLWILVAASPVSFAVRVYVCVCACNKKQ
jgi:hypothetical protein